MAEHHEERLAASRRFLRQPIDLRLRHLVEILRLGTSPLSERSPPGEFDVVIIPARSRVPPEPDARRVVAVLPADLRQRRHLARQLSLVPQRDDLRAEAIAPGEHRRIRRRRRDVRGISPLEQGSLPGEAVEVRRRQFFVTVAAHVIREDRVDREEQDVGLFLFRVVASRCRSL